MENHYYTGYTLIGQQAFAWTRHLNGLITVHDKPAGELRAKISSRHYTELLDLLTSRPEGVCLDVLNIAEPIPDYLGWLFKSFAIPRSHASWLVAIAVEEGFVELEQRGDNLSDYWLMPAGEHNSQVFGEQASIGPAQCSKVDASPEKSQKGSLMTLITNEVSSDLRQLAKQVDQAGAVEEYRGAISLGKLHTKKEIVPFIAGIMEWERDAWGASCIYSVSVDDENLSLRCRDAAARARSRNAGKRRFCYTNGAHRDSHCLYIGETRTLSSRMQQHLGFSHPGAYSLQVTHWRPEQALEGSVVLHATRFRSGTDSTVRRAFEDKLWRMERPLFGRMGGR